MDSQTVAELITVLTAKVDQVQSAVDQAVSSMADWQDSSKEANDGASEAFGTTEVAATAAFLAIADAGAHLVDFAKDAALSAAQTEAMGAALMAVTQATGGSKDAAIAAVQQVQVLGLTEQQATGFVEQLERAHVNMGQAVQLAQVAMNLADSTGTDYGQTLDAVGRAVETGNTRMLRMYGIITTTTTATGKATAALSENQRRQQAINAVLAAGAQVAGVHNAVMQTAEGEIKAVSVAAEEAKDNLGKGLQVPLQAIAGAALAVLNAFNGLNPATRDLIADAIGAAAALVTFFGSLGAIMKVLPLLATSIQTVWTTMLGWNPVILATITAVAALSAAFVVYEQHLDRVNAKMQDFNKAVQQGKTITIGKIDDQSDPQKALEMAKERLAFDEQSLQNEKGLTDYAKAKLQAEQSLLVAKIQVLQNEVATLPPTKQHAATLQELVDKARDLNINQKMLSTDTMPDILKKADEYMKMNDMTYQQQVNYLTDLDRRFKLSADQRIALAQKIADVENQQAQKTKDAWDKTDQGILTDFSATIAQMGVVWINVFGDQTQSLLDIWHSFVNKMLQELIESGILDLLSLILGIESSGGGGLFGSFLSALGIGGGGGGGSPVDVSGGMYDTIVHGQTQASALRGMSTTGGQNQGQTGSFQGQSEPNGQPPVIIVNYNDYSQINTANPSQKRQLARTIGDLFVRNGVNPSAVPVPT